MKTLFLAASLVATAALAAPSSNIGYPSVAAALDALKARTGVKVHEENGWTIIEDPQERSMWSFTPAGSPVYPAVIKRTMIERDGTPDIEMRVLCQASKAACAQLVAQFTQLNAMERSRMQPVKSAGVWSPSRQEVDRATAAANDYAKDVEAKRYGEAWPSSRRPSRARYRSINSRRPSSSSPRRPDR